MLLKFIAEVTYFSVPTVYFQTKDSMKTHIEKVHDLFQFDKTEPILEEKKSENLASDENHIFVCLFVLGLELDVSHGAHFLSFAWQS